MLKLQPDPTFAAAVYIPVPGTKPAQLRVTFRHLNKTDLKAFLEGIENRTPVDALFEVVAGWEHETPFSREALAELLDNYHAAGTALLEKYLHELTGGQIGPRRVEA